MFTDDAIWIRHVIKITMSSDRQGYERTMDNMLRNAELQIRGGIENSSKIIFLFSRKTYVVTPH